MGAVRDVLYVCYDNVAYMNNTGIQRSSALLTARTFFDNPVLPESVIQGKPQPKNLTKDNGCA